jgi:secondary thiamine-phosphate synthase enzyme
MMMQWQQQRIVIATGGRGFYDLLPQLAPSVHKAGFAVGLCHLFLRHTSASLCITENADPDVRADLERFAQRLVPDGSAYFAHDTEGDDDMPAHVRSLLVGCELTVPISAGQLLLGTWQGLYVWEHRIEPQRREVVATLQGSE